MEHRLLLGPLFAMGLAGLIVLAFAFGRRDARENSSRLPLAWFGLLALGLVLIASGVFTGRPVVLVSQENVIRGGALGLVVLAAALLLLGSRTRTRADTLVGSAPLSIDEAVEALRAGRSPGWGVYRGRLGANSPLTSPGGVACGFYDAEVRAIMPDGSRGPLLCTERAYAELLTLRGDKAEVAVSVAASMVLAPVQIRRCEDGRLPVVSSVWERAEGQPLEALSWERVGRIGEVCTVVGELQPGPAQGSYVLRGKDGGPAMLVLGTEGVGTGEALSRKAWSLFAAAGASSITAIVAMSRAF
jgi:hypothetical protein